jgi:hypothetical protein
MAADATRIKTLTRFLRPGGRDGCAGFGTLLLAHGARPGPPTRIAQNLSQCENPTKSGRKKGDARCGPIG